MKYSPKNKRQVPKQLQNEFFEKIEDMTNSFEGRGGQYSRFTIKNLMIQAMAHGYYMAYDKAQENKK